MGCCVTQEEEIWNIVQQKSQKSVVIEQLREEWKNFFHYETE